MSERRQSRLSKPARSLRLRQLLAAARDGDENAIADLWREFGLRFGEDAL